ncbi:MucBP domain protein, partial [Lachnospiraceae bacterium oral taxon 082 str. F0431]
FYRRKNAGNITVKYLETGTNNPVHAQKVLDGTKKLGLNYSESPENVTYYDLDTTNLPTNDSGVYTVSPIIINYYYKRQNAGDVTATYVDVDTNTALHTPEVQSGVRKLGLPYDTDQKSFRYYDLITVPTNKSGNFD